jgi:hypothetical protein
LYRIPHIAVLGAILLTGYLGGAISYIIRISEDAIFRVNHVLSQAPLASVGGQTRAAAVQSRQILQAAKIQDLAALKLARK